MIKYVAHTAAHRVRETAALDIIWGLGHTPEAAIAEAIKNGGEDHVTAEDFDTHPASDALVDYLDNRGGDPQHFQIVDGVADVEEAA